MKVKSLFTCSDTVDMQASKCRGVCGAKCPVDSLVAIKFALNSTWRQLKKSLIKYFPSDSESKSEQVVQPSAVRRAADLEGKLEAQITTCFEALNNLDLGNNLDSLRVNVRRHIKGSFNPPADPLNILLNVSLNCGSLFKTGNELWLQKINSCLTRRLSMKNWCEI